LERQERAGTAGNDPTEWKKTVQATDDRQLYVKASQVFATIRDGARYTKKGRGTIQKDVVATLLVVSPERILLDRYLWDKELDESPPEDPSLPTYLDVRGVRNPSTKARNVRYRVAISPGWEVEFVIQWDCTIINTEQIQAATIDGGRMCGLLNGRAIGMGRFEVTEFETI